MSAQDGTVDIRIELPTYSRSFTVHAAQSSTIRDVKHDITKACPGGPRADGQRLIHKGRFINDEELVKDIWKKPDEARILHLSVHPSAWTDGTPCVPASAPSSAFSPSTVPLSVPITLPVPMSSPYPQTTTIPTTTLPGQSPFEYSTLGYVYLRHSTALSAFSNGIITGASLADADRWRAAAIEMMAYYGWAWPAILDEDYPPPSSGGLKYERVVIEGLPYLSLMSPDVEPTPVQVHALKVLSVTFTILSSLGPVAVPYVPPPPVSVAQTTTVTNLNEHLQRLGLPALRLAPGQIPDPNFNPNDPNLAAAAPAPAVEIRAIPLRAILVPFLMVAFRTILLLYFFGPTKQPFFAILLMGWILYEAWGAIGMVLGNDRARDADRQRAEPAPAAAAPPPPNQAPQHPQPAQQQQRNRPARRNRTNTNRSGMQAFLTGLSSLNLRREDTILDTGANAPPPSLSHKIRTFVGLMLLTLYPAVWDYRRAALRRREGRLRTEANAREAGRSAEGEPGRETEVDRARAVAVLQERRPAWVKEYVERVQTTDWADEL